MNTQKTCPACGSDDLLEGLRVRDQTDYHEASSRDLRIEMQTNPEAILKKGAISTTVNATMCCDCGHVMLFAKPSFASNLKRTQTLKREASELGDPTKHPLYKPFLKSDPAYKHMEISDRILAFGEWLRQHADDTAG